ncbi:MAG: hypothetical protein A3G05_01590 [Candidatus Zambryskibacteria bacterium RIFCSPLOWO2_12_FULL_45_14]|uniref:YdbS-like PH domain-containing protein n=2 Tax=Candidatus Zambryskiibacteriota TaxID=1817925 RepID=A0A1G2UN27_9BACT|nr:MAG: hypothetical protein A3H60_00575 [Candidatus Zambryskibacteria bacterium RIFCSPLOWO2_02_FULL_44_12b]OHB13801.1 MAG: hypothetical protein A3G05_01590 [Candidatus Zambryskibacteria bacterium RIFCSPLOWO2_12_FULL_45_14]
MIRALLSIFKDSPESFEGQEVGEKVIMLLRRHKLVVLLSLSGFALAGLVPIVALTVFSSYIISLNLLSVTLFVASLWYSFLWLAIFHFLTIYTLNTVIITDRRIIDRDQHGFFNQKISELHADRIQDVTAHTKGILETVFHFGDIVVQTAGSERQFVFHKIPEPEKVKSAIMQIVATKRVL